MEHEDRYFDEGRNSALPRDDKFPLTGWPYVVPEKDQPYQRQVGGDHYSKYAIQPTEYIIKNNLNFCEGNVIKYVTRWKDKGGVDDLRKARHYLDMMIEEHSK